MNLYINIMENKFLIYVIRSKTKETFAFYPLIDCSKITPKTKHIQNKTLK